MQRSEISDNLDIIRGIAQKTKSSVVRQTSERLRTVEQDINLFTPAELHQYIDPVTVERNFEQEQSGLTNLLLLVRNFLFILPLPLTLAAIWWAFIQYGRYAALHPQDVNQSFLLLWETGFNTGSILFTASTIAVTDACILLLGSIVGIIAAWQRLQRRKRELLLHIEIERALAKLSDLSLSQMKQSRNSNLPQAQVLTEANLTLQESVKITQNIQVQIVQVVQQIGDFQQNTSFLSRSTEQLGIITREVFTVLNNLGEQIQRVIRVMDNTGNNLDKMSGSLRIFTGDMEKIFQQTTQLTIATQTVAQSTQQLTDSTRSLTSSNQEANQVIRTMLNRLNMVTEELAMAKDAAHDSNRSLEILVSRLAGTEDNTIRATSSLITRLETIQQLLGHLVALTGTRAQGGSFLEGFFGSERVQQSLGINPLRILSLLQTSGPQPIQALMRQVQELMESPLNSAVFSDIIATFRDMDLLTLSGKSGNEQVKLTALGKQIINTLVSP